MTIPIWPDGPAGNVLCAIYIERARQERLRAEGKFPATCATPDGLSPEGKLAVLAEEFGEVARHVTEQLIDPTRLEKRKLRKELVEVAAVCVAWAEALDSEMLEKIERMVDRLEGREDR